MDVRPLGGRQSSLRHIFTLACSVLVLVEVGCWGSEEERTADELDGGEVSDLAPLDREEMPGELDLGGLGGSESDGEGPRRGTPDWLVHLHPTGLYHIDTESLEVTRACALQFEERSVPPLQFVSVTLTRRDVIYGSGGGKLWRVELPSDGKQAVCVTHEIGTFPEDLGFAGISADAEDGLLGLGTDAVLYRIDTDSASLTATQDSGIELGFYGTTWVEEKSQILALTNGEPGSEKDAFYELLMDQEARPWFAYPSFLGGVGMEYHPGSGKLFICSSSTPTYPVSAKLEEPTLFEVNVSSGELTRLGTLDLPSENCSNLGAPWKLVSIIR